MRWELLTEVPDEEVRRVLSIARRRTFARGEVVFHEHDPADSLHLVARGRFAVRITTPLGDSALLALRGPGEAFGELALVSGPEALRSATVESLEAGETHAVYRREFDALRREHPRVGEVLVALLAEAVRRTNDSAARRLLRTRRDACAAPAGGARGLGRRRRGAADAGGSGEPGGHLARDRQPCPSRRPAPGPARAPAGPDHGRGACSASRSAAKLKGGLSDATTVVLLSPLHLAPRLQPEDRVPRRLGEPGVVR